MRCRVLVVEDSAPMRDAVCRILATECDVVGSVDDGSAVLAATALRPDAVVLDISLPGMSGMTLLPFLRDIVPAAAIVMLTNHAAEEYREEAFRRGADAYVLKSTAHQALLPAVRRGRAPQAGSRFATHSDVRQLNTSAHIDPSPPCAVPFR